MQIHKCRSQNIYFLSLPIPSTSVFFQIWKSFSLICITGITAIWQGAQSRILYLDLWGHKVAITHLSFSLTSSLFCQLLSPAQLPVSLIPILALIFTQGYTTIPIFSWHRAHHPTICSCKGSSLFAFLHPGVLCGSYDSRNLERRGKIISLVSASVLCTAPVSCCRRRKFNKTFTQT